MHMFGGFWIDVIIGFVAGLTDSVDAAAVR